MYIALLRARNIGCV